MSTSSIERPEVALFRAYLRVRTDHPIPDYVAGVAFLKAFYDERLAPLNVGIEFTVHEVVPGKPIGQLSWRSDYPGATDRPSVLLLSHMDVVPCDIEFWDRDPWAAEKDGLGNIYGRGTQDMKSCGMQHLFALERLAKLNASPRPRNLFLLWVPDEETGGHGGVETFVATDEFRAMNIGIALDEGLASESDVFQVFHGERACWWVKIIAQGKTGHGSRFIEDPAPQKLLKVVQRLIDFRAEQFQLLQAAIQGEIATESGNGHGEHCIVRSTQLGDVTTLNLTALKAGVTSDGGKTYSINVVPTEAMACFDIRIPPSVDLKEFEAKLKEWCCEGVEGVTYEFVQKANRNVVSSVAEDAEWWGIICGALKEQQVEFEPRIFPAATDSRYLRLLGIPAYGFSPMNRTPVLLHDHNEFLNENVFLRGIDIMTGLVERLVAHEA